MARIVHIALKVDDLEKTTQFYEKVFGFQPVETSKVRDHTSRHLSDGAAVDNAGTLTTGGSEDPVVTPREPTTAAPIGRAAREHGERIPVDRLR